MTETFHHPDGHHYRCVGYTKPRRGLYRDDGKHMTPVVTPNSFYDGIFFERVDPPLWPWKAPSGNVYDMDVFGDIMIVEGTNDIDHEDFAGLSERLAKQAKLNGDA